jgi:uncharacterized phage protein (TIGR02220 family)
MSTIRVEKSRNYTLMSNYHFKEKEMSLKAKGLLSLMLSLPDNWDYSIGGLVSICKENETAIKSTLKELRQFGYLQMIKKMPDETKSGRFEYEYVVYEHKQTIEKQEVENLSVEVLGVENQPQLNINQLNTNKLIINYKYIVDYLNLKANTNYRSTSTKTQTLIRSRFKDGFTEQDFEKVIDNMVIRWKDTEWEQYLRPETLFGTKFESYLNTNIRRNNSVRIREDGSEYANL